VCILLVRLSLTNIHIFSMLPTLGLISYDTLSSHPIVKYSKHVANGLIQTSNELIEFPWEELRHGKRTFDNIISLIRQEESLMCYAISLLRKVKKKKKKKTLVTHNVSIINAL
jgi:hypothetical protein